MNVHDERVLAEAISDLSGATIKLDNPSMDGKNYQDAKTIVRAVTKTLVELQNNLISSRGRNEH